MSGKVDRKDVARQPHELAQAERRRKRSVAIALVLGALVLIFYVLTIAKLGPQVLNRPI